MSFLDRLNNKKKVEQRLTPIIPDDIYQAGVLELKDIIAPSALKITPRLLNLGEKMARTFLWFPTRAFCLKIGSRQWLI